jgi:hypothetical protein
MIDEKDVNLALCESADLIDRMIALGLDSDAEVIDRISTMLFKFSTAHFLMEMINRNDGRPIFKN